ncbi:MAG: FAD-dependent monooxygenase [Pseudomonadota bacterium]
MTEYDLIVLGGGPAGAAAALALAQKGLQVALLDRVRPSTLKPDQPLDPRVVAISPGSMAFLNGIQVADTLRHERIAEYRSMRVHAGSQALEFVAAEHGLDQLGWIVEIANLADAIWQVAARHDNRERNLDLITPAEVDAFDLQPDSIRLKLADGRSLSSQILIGADGARSRVRTTAGIEHRIDDYNQRAIVTHLNTSRPNSSVAWQRFTDNGPLALLPLTEGRSSLVWSVPCERAEELMKLNDAAFLEQLELSASNQPFGSFTDLTQRHAIALVRRQSQQMHQGRVALLGDAARSVHPLAGQGLNLGLADAAELAEALNGWDTKQNPETRLARYARRRLSDAGLIAGGIHFINESRMFGPKLGQLGMGAAFRLLSRSRSLREPFLRRACGLR